jgi:hypothetical protein
MIVEFFAHSGPGLVFCPWLFRGFGKKIALLGFTASLLTGELTAEEAAPGAGQSAVVMVEIEARFVRATAAEIEEALGPREGNRAASILTPGQVENAITALTRRKAEFFNQLDLRKLPVHT